MQAGHKWTRARDYPTSKADSGRLRKKGEER